jgi:transglutaminase-like putative cysteine protease
VWLRIEHTTTFDYDEPISEAYTELRLKPLDSAGFGACSAGGGQRCSSFRLEIDPGDPPVRDYVNRFGNEVRWFDILEPHERLVVVATSEVFTPSAFADEERELSPFYRHDYLMPTRYVQLDYAIRDFASARSTDGEVEAEARSLMEAVRGVLTYEPGATDVHSRVEEVLELGRGVCQDFAHVLIAACRAQGIPARYVSGYLYDPKTDGGETASHAWVDVFTPGRGWISLDPTHGREQDEHYVRLAVGRDYGDVPPTKGVYKGNATERLDVAVSIRAL